MKGTLLFLLGALLALAGCSTDRERISLADMRAESAGDAPPALVGEHRREVAAMRQQPGSDRVTLPDTSALIAEIEKVKRELDSLLSDPAAAVPFRDFTAPPQQALRRLAEDEDALLRALADGIELTELEAFVFARNPRIATAYKQLRATVERYPQVVHVETLLSQYTSFLADLMLDAGPAIHRDPVAMKFPAPGVLSLKGDLVSREVDLARSSFEKAVRDQLVAASTALFDLWFLQQSLSYEQEVIGLLRQLERTVSSRLETARAEKSQVLQVQVEISALDNDLITLEQQRLTVEATLRALLDLPPDAPLGAAQLPPSLPSFPAEIEPLYSQARDSRQELRLARDRLRRVDTAIELAEKMTYPDYTLGLGYFKGVRPVGEEPPTGAVTPADFGQRPMGARTYWFGHNESYLREVREMRQGLAHALTGEERSTELGVRREHFALDEARRRLQLLDEVVLSQARQAHEDTLSGYQNDRVEFLNVIDTLRRLLAFDLDRARAYRDYLSAYVQLEAAVGATLTK